jgi:hypothetical protein
MGTLITILGFGFAILVVAATLEWVAERRSDRCQE